MYATSGYLRNNAGQRCHCIFPAPAAPKMRWMPLAGQTQTNINARSPTPAPMPTATNPPATLSLDAPLFPPAELPPLAPVAVGAPVLPLAAVVPAPAAPVAGEVLSAPAPLRPTGKVAPVSSVSSPRSNTSCPPQQLAVVAEPWQQYLVPPQGSNNGFSLWTVDSSF